MIDANKIWSSSHLPTLPTVAMKLLELARDPETEFTDVIALVKTDPAITANILKSANSSFFGFKSPVTSIERAVPLLGTTVVTTLALSFSLVDGTMWSGPLAQCYTAYWKQSIVQAVAAEVMAEHYSQGLSCDCFLSGLLLDLGRLAMLKTISREYVPVLTEWEARGGSLPELEASRLGIDHVQIGVQLLRNWKMPPRLVIAATLHHAPIETALAELADESAVTERVAVAAAAVGDYFCTIDKGRALERIPKLTSEFFRLDRAACDEYLARTRERIDRAGDLFCVDFAGLPSSSDLMAEANEQLARLAVREQMASTQIEIQRKAAEEEKQILESKNEELRERSMRDPLTGLYTRAFFAEALTASIAAASRSAALVGVIFTDIDFFKKLNDTFGHTFGDEVLRHVAALHREVLRKSDIIARYGGEEFVVLAAHPTEKGLAKVCERLRQSVESASFIVGERRVPVTLSVGAAIALPERDSGDLALRLVAAADEAMYESKRNGRNQIHVRSLVDEADKELARMVAQRRFSRWLVQNDVFDVPTISQALSETSCERLRLGALAQIFGYLTPEQIEEIRQKQQESGDRFGRCAVACGCLTLEQLSVLLAIQAEPPSLLARTLTTKGLLDKSRADVLLAKYRDWVSTRTPTAAALL